MKRSKIKVTQLFVLIALCCALLVGNFNVPTPVAAAATKKTSISATKLTIPVGKMDSKVYWNTSTPWDFGSAQKVTVANKVKGATYKFTSSNAKVVKISNDGGYLTGLKAGSATITCTQTYKKKNTTVGKCTVTVKSAAFTVNEIDTVFPVGSDAFDLYDLYACGAEPLFNIAYRNQNATYALTSDNNNFTIKEVKYDASKVKDVTDDEFGQEMLTDYIGKRSFYGYQFTAKKAGTYKITVKETYNKKTKTLGSFNVEIKDTSISEPKQDLLLGKYLNVLYLLNYTNANTEYYFKINDYDDTNPDNNVVTLNKDESGDLYLYANKAGTAEVTVTEGTEQGTVIGTVTIVVSEASCQGITVDSKEYTTYVDDYFEISYDLEPYETTDKVTIESDKPDVLKVEYNKEDEDWSYSPLKVGEANITIKCGDQSVVCKVVVEEY